MPDSIICTSPDAPSLAPLLVALRRARAFYPTTRDGYRQNHGDDAPTVADQLPALVASWRATPDDPPVPLTLTRPTPLPWEDVTDVAA